VVVTLIFTALLSLIIIGSNIAFAIITSIAATGLFASYIVAIGCLISKRLRGEPLPPSRFTLGRAGLYVNIVALCFLSVAFVILFFPAAPHPTVQSMNWASLIFGSVVIFAGVYYYFRGRHNYVGPVEFVKTV
jgi:choline transport protein